MLFIQSQTGSLFSEKDFKALSQHIEMHKYLINKNIPWTVTFEEAAFSWGENVFFPIMETLRRWEVKHAFKHIPLNELFFQVSDHWYFLQESNPNVPAQYAAIDYAARYGKGLGKYLSHLMIPNKAA